MKDVRPENDVLYSKEGAVVTISMNRPAQRNALNESLRSELFAAWKRFAQDSTARVAILTATGDKAFCAGRDLKESAQQSSGPPPPDYMPVIGENIEVDKPTIAAVNGYAVAGGWLLAQMCDLCVAAEHATFAITEAKVGRGVPWATPLIHMLPKRIVLELVMTGAPISARRLYELGYVNSVVPINRLQSTAMELANSIASNAPLTVAAARQTVLAATEHGHSEARRRAEELFDPVYRSADALEGPRAFAEKRAPRWLGR